jgi:anaerobic selenocysteine-containing dehydrogenase
MKDSLSRRNFLKGIGAGTTGLGFGVSLFDGIYQYAEAATEEERHSLLMKGSAGDLFRSPVILSGMIQP